MNKILTFVFLSVTAVTAIYFLGLQIAYIHVEHMLEWAVENNSFFWPTLDISYLFFDSDHFYIWLLTLIAVSAVVDIFFNTMFSKSERELRRHKRMLSAQEKKNYTHLASKHEAKKGMQRMEFDRFGHLRDKTPVQAVGIFLRMLWIRICLRILKRRTGQKEPQGQQDMASFSGVGRRSEAGMKTVVVCAVSLGLFFAFVLDPWRWIPAAVVAATLIFRIGVFVAALAVCMLKEHVMPAVWGYKSLRWVIACVSLVLGFVNGEGWMIPVWMGVCYVSLTLVLQCIDFFCGLWKALSGSSSTADEELAYLKNSFTVLKRACGLLPYECDDDRLHMRCVILLYRACTFRNTVDEIFDGVKRLWNRLCTLLELPDIYRMNTIHTWMIGDEKKHFRGGLPVLSYWRKIYVDPDDDHTLIVSASKSGKSWSFILILIDSCRMAGESMVINDPKGEIRAEKYNVLIEDGYKVRVVDFIDPEHSDGWNPLYMIAKAYVEERDEYLRQLKDIDQRIGNLEGRLRQGKDDLGIEEEIDLLLHERSQLHANHSRSDMYIEDLRKQLTYDKNAKDKTWDSSSGDVITGLIYLLLEEFDREDSDISLEHINFKSVQAVYNEGTVMERRGNDMVTRLSKWLYTKRPKEDKSFDALSAYAMAADPTRKSIDIAYKKNTNYLNIDEGVQKLLSVSTFDFKDIGREKTAVFIVVHGDKNTYYPLVSLMVDQMYTQLMELAREQYKATGKERLPVPVTMLLDEFGIFPPLGSISNIMTFARSAGVRMVMACQDFNQLADTYGEYVSKILQNNSMNFVYLMGQDPDTLQRIENMCGFKLRWDKETGRYEKMPTVTKERLGTLSFGEALIKMQRKNPLITRFRGHDRYIFYKNLKKGYSFQGKKLPSVKVYDLAGRMRVRIRLENRKQQRSKEATGQFSAVLEEEKENIENLTKTKKSSNRKSFGVNGWKSV